MKESQPLAADLFGATLLLLLLSVLSQNTFGAAGDVDLSFDPGSGVNGPVNGVAVQPDGKAIIGGQFTTVKGLARRNIARLNADGIGDSSFAAGPPFTNPNTIYALALQADGKVLVGQDSDANYGITRLNADGSYDTNFNNNAYAAIASTSPTDPFRVTALIVQPDGKVLYAGENLLRLNSNGTLDTNFHSGAIGYVSAMARQPDGKLIVGGYFYVGYVGGSPIGYGLARLNTDGSIDNTFDQGAGQNGLFSSIVVQPDGKVLVGGSFIGTNDNSIVRLNANGTVDSTFAAVSRASMGGHGTEMRAIGLQPDGKMLVGGIFISINGTPRTNLTRLNTNGTLDLSFTNNADGLFGAAVQAISVQTNGTAFIGGSFTTVHGTSRRRVARLNADGTVNASFDPGGGVESAVSAVALQPDGKVLVGDVFTFVNGTNRYGSERLNADGSSDSNFLSNTNFRPELTTAVPSGCYDPSCTCLQNIVPLALVVQTDGKVLIGGYSTTTMDCYPEGGDYFVRHFLARFNVDGSLDPSFEAAIGNRSLFESVDALAVQPDGKVIVGGSFTSIKNTARQRIARLNANGTLDTSFNSGSGANGTVSSIVLQPDGKLLLGGSFTTINGTNRSGIARLTSTGGLDTSFSSGTGVAGTVYSIRLQTNGRALIGGAFTNVNGTNRQNIARLNGDGSLDSSFNQGSGANGIVRSIALQTNGNAVIGGEFITVNGIIRPRVARLYGDSTLPTLSIARSNGSAVLSWPAAFGNFQLQSNTNISLSNGWSSIAAARSTNNGSISVIISATGIGKFFRLSSP